MTFLMVSVLVLALPAVAQPVSDAASYALKTCPVSGQELGAMGDPVVKEIAGRQVAFCCEGCVAPYEEDVDAYSAQIDAAIIEQQLDAYPLETCLVMDSVELGAMGEPVNHVYGNRLIRFCCEGCIAAFEDEPQTHLAKLDAAVVEKQREDYPLDVCPVMGRELGAGAVDVVIANRLVRVCCQGCVGSVKATPAKFLQAIDDARDQ